MERNERIDRRPGQRQVYESNRRRVLAAQNVCSICGMPVDKTLSFPDPMSASVDHIVPASRGGTNSIDNLAIAHLICNRVKSNKMMADGHSKGKGTTGGGDDGNNFPQHFDWFSYRAD